MQITIKNQNFTLHHFGAIYWEAKKVLLISDVHFGKVTHFRKHGLAIPNEAILENFNKLDDLLALFNPQKIIFLGDLFHSTINIEWELFANWTQEIKQEIILVEGNHDIIAKNKYSELNIEVLTELVIDDFYLTHHPCEKATLFNFCGHIHPSVKLSGIGKQYLKIPCFFRKPNQLILPAFGEFTGNFSLVPKKEDKVYAITKDEVVEIALA